jgi:hypothetical protein
MLQIEGRVKDDGALTNLDFKAKSGDLSVSTSGTIKELSLVGADLTLKVEHTDIGPMLASFELPGIASGPMRIDTRIRDVGKYRELDFQAKLSDLTASVKGTFKTRGLAGADLAIKLEHTDIGPVLTALKLPLITTGPMQVDSRIKDVGKRRELDFKAKIGDLAANVKGTLKTRGLVGSDLKFEATAVLPVCSRSAVCPRRRSPCRDTRCIRTSRSRSRL